MLKSDLYEIVTRETPGLSRPDAIRIIDTIFEEITDALSRGDRVELRNFGAFSVRTRDARTGRNPRTGDVVDVPETHKVHFKCGKGLFDRMNASH